MIAGEYCRSCEYVIDCDSAHKMTIIDCHDYKPHQPFFEAIITNGDKIRSLKINEDLADAIIFAYKKGLNYTDSRLGIVEWLNERLEE